MTKIELWTRQQRLDNLFEIIRILEGDPELTSHWARYLCVQVSGFLETSIQTVLSDYARCQSSKHVSRFVDAQVGRFQNLNMERILNLVGQFDPDWEKELRIATEDEPKDAVDSVVANRNRIAHGEDVGITFGRVSRYYDNAKLVVDLLQKKCNGSPAR